MTKATRTLSFLGTAAVLTALSFAGANAAVLLNETFPYPDGPLAGTGGWLAHSGAGNKIINVASGAAVLEQSSGSGEDINKVFGPQAANAKTYASFDVSVSSVVGWTGDVYFFHFKDSGTLLFRARVYAGPAGAGQWTLKFDNDGATGTVPDAVWGTPLALGTSYKVVVSYDASTGATELWVNPAAESDPKIVSSSTGAAGTLIEAVALRQASPATGNCFQRVDNIKVGNAFADVVDAPVPAEGATFGRIKNLYR